ncbi:MAG: hypothetical protein PHD73_08525 [Sediminibacterium sp.]|nr:hypothetical protein [Sediminibacterium sp.]
MKQFFCGACAIILLASCSGNQKTVIVMSKGSAEVNLNAGTIKATDGAGHDEKTVKINSKKVNFALTTPVGNTSVELVENGLYVINVKNDTIIGSYQQYSSADKAQTVISQESLKQKIDSLILLSEGKNVSAANRNFFILPNQATKITDNANAQVVGPYHQMRSAEKVDGVDPEIYRFYSIKEIREMIVRLQALTVAPAPKP